MNRRTFVCSAAAASATFLIVAPPVYSESGFPNKPIELVVPYPAGGGTDVLARAFAEASRKHMNQTMLVMNRPGAGGAIGINDMIRSKPDGYKLSVITTDLLTLPLLGLAKFNYEDVQPIAQLNYDPSAVTVRADAPWNTIGEFLKAAKAFPSNMRIGNSGSGSIWHIAATALEEKTGAKFTHVPFQGASPAVLALIGGHIDAVTVSPAEVASHVKAGKLKMLVVMSDQRIKGHEKVPTAKEAGIDVNVGTWRAIAAPKGTPPEVVAKLREIAAKAAAEQSFKDVVNKQELGYAYADGPSFKATLVKDNTSFKQLIGKLNVTP
ncbi:tripartite tricarboxylate transporter substrate binding protein (plasmid) [Cupriavidus necator]|uniref:Tripartite tricarboxylate transporter substrate binding protein n=1 Tax=Cupriavidus necator TaxID=106590 RepID=A0A367PAG4_CUPNE|nr:tripartite tricarboxylate transporter substrate binding protein [Cupriavidus necator]QQX89564.1 tripartite tricarboxylate transporter substrate binding protein [Cupriavidus necator]RCJ04075.1 tripartite tricarboxylate transporter substrate binding protein [Cupriavidus necator]